MVEVKFRMVKKDFVYVGLIVVLLGIGFGYAYGGNDPAVMGHSAGEVEGAVPSGGVVAFNLDSCPAGWSPADGAGGTPDLRGVFIRGMNSFDNGVTNRTDGNEDPDGLRVLGVLQQDELESHTHGGRTMAGSQGWCPRAGCGDYGGVSAMASFGGDETRPKNVALIYCQKN